MKLDPRPVLAGAAALAAICLSALPACAAEASAPPPGGAVVIVSGGDAVSPFTTPTEACRSGLAAGNTDTALREYLLKQGHRVFTSPAMAGRGPVVEQGGFGAFGDCPAALPEIMTVNSVGDIDLAGERLARFLGHLATTQGVTEVDLVGHSMGGLFSRAAIKVLKDTGSPIRIRSLTTLGTPWEGAFLADYANGTIPLATCNGQATCEEGMRVFRQAVESNPPGAGGQVTRKVLAGPSGWNEAQGDALAGIPVVLIGGDYFSQPGIGEVWPNDGIVAIGSALAQGVSDRVLPHRRCMTAADTHSIYVSEAVKADWSTGLTWDPKVLAAVHHSIAGADRELASPNRQGCPAP